MTKYKLMPEEPVGEVTIYAVSRWGLLSKQLPVGAKLYSTPPHPPLLLTDEQILDLGVDRMDGFIRLYFCGSFDIPKDVLISIARAIERKVRGE